MGVLLVSGKTECERAEAKRVQAWVEEGGNGVRVLAEPSRAEPGRAEGSGGAG
jgi:hypothetical protein